MKFANKRVIAAVAVAAALTLTLAGCGGSNKSSTSSGDGGTLTLGAAGPVSSFAAADSQWGAESPYLQSVYDTLVREKPDGTIIPWLATKWSWNEERTVLTMTLRDDVKFTDGTRFTADVAAQNLTRFRDGQSPDKSLLGSLKTAKAIDDTTLELELNEPDPALLNILAVDGGLQESPKAFNSASAQTVPVGSGPYLLDTKATVVGSSYVFTKNPDYWAPEQQYYAKIVIKVYSTATAQLNAIKGGQVNALSASDNSIVSQVKASGFDVDPVELNWAGLILFDRAGKDTPALADVRVRQAINYAIDRKALLKAVGQNLGTVTTQVFPAGSSAYDKSLDSFYDYDPAKAKELLTAAGYSSGSITLTQPQAAFFGSAVYALVKQELNAIGINVNYVDEGNNFIADVLAPKYSSTYMTLQESNSAWLSSALVFAPKAPWNPYHYSDATVDALLKTLQTTSSTDEVDTASKKLNTYLVKQAWFAPFYRQQSSFVSDKDTKVVVQSDSIYPSLWNITPRG